MSHKGSTEPRIAVIVLAATFEGCTKQRRSGLRAEIRFFETAKIRETSLFQLEQLKKQQNIIS